MLPCRHTARNTAQNTRMHDAHGSVLHVIEFGLARHIHTQIEADLRVLLINKAPKDYYSRLAKATQALPCYMAGFTVYSSAILCMKDMVVLIIHVCCTQHAGQA